MLLTCTLSFGSGSICNPIPIKGSLKKKFDQNCDCAPFRKESSCYQT